MVAVIKKKKSGRTGIRLSSKKKLSKVKKPEKIASPEKAVVKAPLSVVRNYGDEQYLAWAFEHASAFIEGFTDNHGDPTVLYPYQVEFMSDPSVFRFVNKSRQTGFSFVVAAESLAKAHMRDSHLAIFISINREEASNKIDYARALFESMPLGAQKNKIVDNKYSLEFETHDGKHRTKLVSLAQRGPRGPGYNTDVYLDEFAHFHWSKEIYVAALPIISRGQSSLAALSTPFGNKGQFADIFHDRKSFSEFKIFEIPWWDCLEFCKDVVLAQKHAPVMGTHERIGRFAKSKLKQIFKNLPLIDFQQEYECVFVDEATAYFPLELIKRNTFYYEEEDWIRDIDLDIDIYERQKYQMEEKYPNIDFTFYKTLDALFAAIQSGKVSKNLTAGYDVGRVKDSSELCIIEERPANGRVLKIVRCIIDLDNVPFRDQEAFLDKLLKTGLIHQLYIDETGMGKHLAENLNFKYRQFVEPITFTNFEKAVMAKKVRICFEDQSLAIPDNVDVVRQTHSIRRTVTQNSNERFEVDVGDGKQHHADIFWAMALAVHAGTEPINYEEYDGEEFIVTGQRIMAPLTGEARPNINAPGEQGPIVSQTSMAFINNPLGSLGDVPSDLDGLDFVMGGRKRY